MGWGFLEAVQEEEVCSLEEARRALTELRERNKAQSHLLVAWKRRLKQQNMMLVHLQRERDDHLRNIQSQLMLFESQLRRRQKEVSAILQEKDSTIRQQQQIILTLSKALNASQKAREISESERKTKRQTCDTANNTQNSNESDTNGVGGENEDNHRQDEKSSMTKGDQENLNDSDSAIMLEENLDSLILIPLGKGEVKVVRSVSDAVEVASRSASAATSPGVPAASSSLTSPQSSESSLLKPGFSSSTGTGSLSTSPSCSSEESDDSPVCTLTKGRMELLRTVYSLDEEEISHARQDHDLLGDASLTPLSEPVTPSLHSILKSTSHYDSDATLSDGDSDDDDEEDSSSHHDDSCSDRRRLLGSYEKLNTLVAPVKPKPEDEIQVTYNRVMSNHRSVTKPKDVKYRRINKAKSRSLEELRGKLKYWTDRGGKQSLSVDLDTHSFA
ncbi:dentin sialophosphoprotein [Palaemon carinicauda]|uniref:dentin sialophosphoprotein n=1 Tax=Palaemon carinicauda TaxID=392227 RepID=UPI0035B6438A